MEEHTRYSEQQSLYLAITESLNNAGEEVLEGLRENRHVLGEHEEVEAVVCQTELDALPDRARVCVVRLADIGHQAP